MPFNPGDTVRLKSGSPLMTVTNCAQQDGVWKVWTVYFDDKNEKKDGFFPAAALEADDGTI